MSDLVEVLQPNHIKAESGFVTLYHKVGRVIITAVIDSTGKQKISIERRISLSDK